MITFPISWFSEYNSLVLTGILLANIALIVRFMYLDMRDRHRRKKQPPCK